MLNEISMILGRNHVLENVKTDYVVIKMKQKQIKTAKICQKKFANQIISSMRKLKHLFAVNRKTRERER